MCYAASPREDFANLVQNYKYQWQPMAAMEAMAAGKTTLEVRKETKDRVNAVKGPLTTDELINLALDHLPAERVAQLFEEWQKEAFKALRSHPKLKGRFH